MIPKNTQKKSWLTLLKVVVAAVAFGLILSELSKVPQRDWWTALTARFITGDGVYLFLLTCLLIPLNWGIEAFKWQRMIGRIEQLGFLTAFRAVLGGVTVSMFTPNRIGEFAGRVLVLEHDHRVQGAIVTVAQSFSQSLVTLLAGTIALALQTAPEGYRLAPLLVLLVTISTFSGLLYFGFGPIAGRLSRFGMLNKWRRQLAPLADYTFRELAIVLLLSFLRYAVFVFQFYLLLRFFSVGVELPTAVTRIALIYLSGLWIPSFSFTEPLTRAGMAIVLFHDVTLQTEEVVFATSALWLLNLMLPALAGCFTVYGKSGSSAI